MKAFKQYLKNKHKGNISSCTEELISIAINNPGGTNIIWRLLEETGENHYTRDTFEKIAGEIMKYEPPKS